MTDGLDQYFVETATEIFFLDPLFRTKLDGHEPPPSVQQDPIVSSGLAQLRKLAAEDKLTLQLLQSIHWGAEDFQDMLRDSGDTLLNAKIVGIEMGWKSHFDENGGTRLSDVKHLPVEVPQRRAFQEEQMSWLIGHNKIVIPCEYPDNFTSKFQQSYDKLLGQTGAAEREDDERTSILLWGLFHYIRQWVFLSTLGYWLYQLDSQDELPSPHLTVPFMCGSGHWALKNKLNVLGIPWEYHTVKNRTLGEYPALTAADEAEDVISAYARISVKQLDEATKY